MALFLPGDAVDFSCSDLARVAKGSQPQSTADRSASTRRQASVSGEFFRCVVCVLLAVRMLCMVCADLCFSVKGLAKVVIPTALSCLGGPTRACS